MVCTTTWVYQLSPQIPASIGYLTELNVNRERSSLAYWYP